MKKEYDFRYVDLEHAQKQLKRNLSIRYLVLFVGGAAVLIGVNTLGHNLHISPYIQVIFIAAVVLGVILIPMFFIGKTVGNLTIPGRGVIDEEHIIVKLQDKTYEMNFSDIDYVYTTTRHEHMSGIKMKSGSYIDIKPSKSAISEELNQFLEDLIQIKIAKSKKEG